MRLGAALVACSACVSTPARPTCSAQRALSELNKTAHDAEPWLSADRTELLFHSNRPSTAGGYELWRTIRAGYDGTFAAPAQVAGDFVGTGDLTGPSMNDDGVTLYFSKAAPPGTPAAIWEAKRASRTSTTFTTTMMLVAEGNHSSVSSDGKTIYYDKDMPPHLFRATRGSLGEPFGNEQRIDELATGGGERQPSISRDGNMLLYTLIDPNTGQLSVVRSHHGSVVFGPPEPVAETAPSNPMANVHGARLHDDDVTIVFTSDVVGGAHDDDLYITCE